MGVIHLAPNPKEVKLVKVPTKDILCGMNDKLIEAKHRSYIGLSGIGNECHRYLQYCHYWAFDRILTARQARLLRTGHDSEFVMDRSLGEVGVTCEKFNGSIIGETGHWKGHPDRVLSAGWRDGKFLGEYKTHNDQSFNNTVKHGVLKAHPEHYYQTTAYMGYTGYKVCLYLAMNKNNSEYYWEWIPFNTVAFDDLKRKQWDIVLSSVILPRIGPGRTFFKCKWCDAADVCYGDVEPSVNCRTCNNVEVLDGGRWVCSLHEKDLSVDEQRAGCPSYVKGSMFK